MRVVIVGLLPAQAQIIKSEFPGLDLRIFHKDTRESASTVSTAAARADRAIVMTRFVGHKAVSTLSRHNVTMVNGAMTQLREVLRMLDATAHAEALPALRSVASLPAPPPHTPLAPLLMAGLKQNDFTALKTAKPGDVFAFKRPHNVSKDAFERQVGNSRSNYRTRYGVVSSMAWDGDEIHVLVEAVGEATAPAAPETATPVAAAATPATDTPPPETPAPAGTLRAEDIHFWQEVYLQAQKDRYHPEQCATIANAAVDAMYTKMGRT